jgi:hypothetical protein
VAEQRRSAAPRAHVGEPPRGTVAHGQHVVLAHEDVDLADGQAIGADVHGVQDDEQRVAILLDLRPLVAVAGVLDGQLVQGTRCIASSSGPSGSDRATHTKHPDRRRYSEILSTGMSVSFRPSS